MTMTFDPLTLNLQSRLGLNLSEEAAYLNLLGLLVHEIEVCTGRTDGRSTTTWCNPVGEPAGGKAT